MIFLLFSSLAQAAQDLSTATGAAVMGVPAVGGGFYAIKLILNRIEADNRETREAFRGIVESSNKVYSTITPKIDALQQSVSELSTASAVLQSQQTMIHDKVSSMDDRLRDLETR